MTHTTSGRVSGRHFVSLMAAAMLVASCTSGPLAGGAAGREGSVSSDVFGNATIQVGGRTFRLKALDGKAVGSLSIQAGGKFYNAREGQFSLPESALRDAKSDSRGFFRVFVQGYVPRQVWIGQAAEEIDLVPMVPAAVVAAMSVAGGALRSPDGSLDVTIPPSLLTKAETNIALSSYTPAPQENAVETGLKTRADFLAKLSQRAGATPYRLSATEDCPAPNQPLPCPPALSGLGLMLTVDGPLRPGTIVSRLDLNAMMRGWNGTGAEPWAAPAQGWTPHQAADARAAAQILATYANIDAHPNGAAYRALLSEAYGLRLEGRRLTFSVTLGDNAATDGFTRIEVDGVSLLGVTLEFTAVSSITSGLPPAASTAGLIALAPPDSARGVPWSGNAGVSLLGQDGAGIISGGAGNIISGGAGNIISGGAGNIISGGAGNIISGGAGNIISNDGASIISGGAGNLLGQDAAGLVALDGSAIISGGAGNLIGLDGAGMVSTGSGSLISNVGGSLAGHVELPVRIETAKYRVASYQGFATPHEGRVRAITAGGQPISEWVTIDADSNYHIIDLPPTPGYFYVEYQWGHFSMRALAMAPAAARVVAHINAPTSAVTSLTAVKLLANPALAANLRANKYNADVAFFQSTLDQAAALDLVTDKTIGQVATLAEQRLSLLGLPLQVLAALTATPCLAPVGLSPLLGQIAVLASSTVTNTGPTVLVGDLDLYPGTSVTGFPAGMVLPPSSIYRADPVALQAQTDLTGAYNDAVGRVGFTTLPITMGGQTLSPGVYRSASQLTLSNAGLTLDASGDPNAVFIFQIGSALTLNSGGAITLVNGAQARNVFWQVGSSATLGTYSSFKGTLMANISITLTTGAVLEGRALARTGAVTLDNNTVTAPPLSQTTCP